MRDDLRASVRNFMVGDQQESASHDSGVADLLSTNPLGGAGLLAAGNNVLDLAAATISIAGLDVLRRLCDGEEVEQCVLPPASDPALLTTVAVPDASTGADASAELVNVESTNVPLTPLWPL